MAEFGPHEAKLGEGAPAGASGSLPQRLERGGGTVTAAGTSPVGRNGLGVLAAGWPCCCGCGCCCGCCCCAPGAAFAVWSWSTVIRKAISSLVLSGSSCGGCCFFTPGESKANLPSATRSPAFQ